MCDTCIPEEKLYRMTTCSVYFNIQQSTQSYLRNQKKMRDVTALYMSKLLYIFFLIHAYLVHIHEISDEISPRINRYLKCDKWSIVTSNFTPKNYLFKLFLLVFLYQT